MATFSQVVGRNYESRIIVLNPSTQAKVTGLTSANFTFDIIKGTTGNQPTTGLTMTEVDSVNNPGEYDITVSGSNGFSAAVGVYQVTATRTATLQVYTDTVYVTADGTPSGTYGQASFTATSGNGRITDGTNPLAGATVTFLRPTTNAFYAQLTTTATGLYPFPVYFDASGTWTYTAQKSGYSVGTGTITVAGTVATGPSTDTALTVISAASGLTASSLWAYARRMMKDRTGNKSDTEITQLVNDALTTLAFEAQWPWLLTLGVVNIQPAYITGTINPTNGSPTITLTGGTWPTWAASGELLLNYQWYQILSRDSGTQLTLVNNYQDVTQTAQAPLLVQWKYQVPTNLSRIESVICGVNRFWNPDPTSRAYIEMLRSAYNASANGPIDWAIEKDNLYIWPYYTQTAANALPVNILYYRRPADLVTSTDNADWDYNQRTVLLRSIDMQVAIRGECMAGDYEKCHTQYMQALTNARPNDRTSVSRNLALATPNMSDHRPIGVNVIG